MALGDMKKKSKLCAEPPDNQKNESLEWKDNGKIILNHIKYGSTSFHRKMIIIEKLFVSQKKNSIVCQNIRGRSHHLAKKSNGSTTSSGRRLMNTMPSKSNIEQSPKKTKVSNANSKT